MTITATVVDPIDIKKIKYGRISFSDVPIDGNLISIENEMYRIYRTLFKQKDTSFVYDFEQLIKKEVDITKQIPKGYHLILGQVSFDLNDEVNSFFKEIKISQLDNEINNVNDGITLLPYSYIRMYDFVQVNGRYYICEKMVITDEPFIRLELFQVARTINDFREDKNNFLTHIGRY